MIRQQKYIFLLLTFLILVFSGLFRITQTQCGSVICEEINQNMNKINNKIANALCSGLLVTSIPRIHNIMYS